MSDDFWNSCSYLDTNIFIYLFDNSDPLKNHCASLIYDHFLRNGNGRISVQVISEWRNVIVKKYGDIVGSDTRREFLLCLKAFNPWLITPDTVLSADKLCDKYALSAYDSIHVQSAIEMQCSFLLSEDLQHGQIIENRLKIVNPFIEKRKPKL
ncbi:MAG: PIN domain-containing protein [Lentisphaerota bacterium]